MAQRKKKDEGERRPARFELPPIERCGDGFVAEKHGDLFAAAACGESGQVMVLYGRLGLCARHALDCPQIFYARGKLVGRGDAGGPAPRGRERLGKARGRVGDLVKQAEGLVPHFPRVWVVVGCGENAAAADLEREDGAP